MRKRGHFNKTSFPLLMYASQIPQWSIFLGHLNSYLDLQIQQARCNGITNLLSNTRHVSQFLKMATLVRHQITNETFKTNILQTNEYLETLTFNCWHWHAMANKIKLICESFSNYIFKAISLLCYSCWLKIPAGMW